uniref:Uncharacterized protein n=1 Tax=Lepeophtheirus salmonis TaxID=72036 RepID=A0A0K2T1I2_LEPSM
MSTHTSYYLILRYYVFKN